MIDHQMVSEALAEQLLHEYRTGASFFFSSPERTILAKGVFAAVPEEDGSGLEHLSQRAAAVLRDAEQSGRKRPIIVGAVPFDNAKPAQLTVPDEVWCAGPLVFEQSVQKHSQQGMAYDIQPVPEPEAYIRGVERGLAGIAAGDYSKIVLSRSLRLTSPEKIDIGRLLQNLAQHNTNGYTFAVDLPERAKEESHSARTLIGASPELLVSRTGFRVSANPLAGSRPRSDDPVEDQRRADELLASAKDRHEHAVVVQAVAAALKPFCRKLNVPAEPSLISTETMWHLSTEINGELTDLSISSLELAAALHPTPAVCGTPTDKARAAIKEIEPFDRGFFTGMVGWCDSVGDGEWVVTIRCAEAEDHALRLFAGAGIVAGSRPEDELAETSAKFRTMLLAMGLNNE
ncbi:isochorismate synthase DhbC [Bacillus sonorensis]|uniref:isochorismate synthase n=2 Tax=Bacillus sonorensis TaxID=119858 RepID=M5PC21_9BACI|nr:MULTISPECIES: isochorismate synthase DhbC [Bacillus]TWK80673.1 Isochorismate synthase DhbC [Bacillus paralicheniformis]ASB87043.1 Isochorismate synthase [Bacillus sonorensis]EME73470.1 isochorismate synthase DhbC [Bacillus sonorensis L12]MBG9914446.1 isochorismate synthase [Bacillus sonorensis]MCF7616293.1 isochorismate synthase DhbC [Bacillus sonorensis]